MHIQYTHCVLNRYQTVLKDTDLNVVGALSRYIFVLQHHLVHRYKLFSLLITWQL